VRLDPKSTEYQYDLGDLLKDERKYSEAETHLREAIRLGPMYPEYQVDLKDILEQEKK
jgi:tetratricopeptide (TPR) repeat protein